MVSSGQLTNGTNSATNNTQFVNVEVERLFHVGVWMDVNAYTTTLGSKFNLYRNFQLGGQLFYTGNYFTQSLVTSSGSALVPQSLVAGMISVGLTY